MMSGFSEAGRILMVRWGDITHMNNIVTLVNYLTEKNFKVTLVTVAGHGQPPASLDKKVELVGLNIDSSPESKKITQFLLSAWRLKKLLKESRWDILYVVDSWTLKTVLFANNFAFRRKGMAFVYHSFDWLEPGLHAWFHRALEAAACRSADLVINADRARARLQQSLYRLKSTPLYLLNGLSKSVRIHTCDPALRIQLLSDDAPPNSILLVYPTVAAGTDSFQRMTFELIQAFHLLPPNYFLATFFAEGQYYQKCADYIEANGLGSRVKFLRPVPFDRLMAYLACADLGAIFYNDKLSSGYFMCNADKLSLFAANGIPFVASDYPNLEAVVYKFKLGICCDATHPELIARAIMELTSNLHNFALHKIHARKVFAESLSFESQGRRYIDALHKLAQK